MSHCRGSGMETYYDNINSTNARKRKCTNCGGRGEIRCSSHAKSTSLIGKGLRMATSDSCKGAGTIQCEECNTTGKITCGKCEGSGEVTCKKCEGDGTIVCSICYEDNDRYGKVDCHTCHTRGEIGEIVIIYTEIELHDTESLFQLGKPFPEANFSASNQLELIKRYIKPKYKTQETYYKAIEKAGNEMSRENIDDFSKPIISNRRTTLNIRIDKYPKLLEEYIYYEVVPSLSVSYKHILTNTEHKLSFIGIDSDNPAIVFHSKPSEVILEKKSLKETIVQILSKAFSTKRFKDKIDKRNAIVLLIHMAKSDQTIDHTEKLFLSKKIQDLNNFTAQEKKLLFTLMSAQELPEIRKKYARFSCLEKEEEVKNDLVELAKLSSNIGESEQQMLGELNSLIDNSRQSKFAKFMLNFLSAWQISIPSIILIILPLIAYLLAIVLSMILMMFGPTNSEEDSHKLVISDIKEENVIIDSIDIEENIITVLISLPKKYFGHWVVDIENCKFDGGVWISENDGEISVNGYEWSSVVTSIIKKDDSYVLKLDGYSEGEAFNDTLILKMDNNNNNLIYNEDFSWIGDDNTLIKCGENIKPNSEGVISVPVSSKKLETSFIGTYKGVEEGDYFHVEFLSEDGELYDFGGGENDYSDFELFIDNENGETIANANYVDKKFIITWANKKVRASKGEGSMEIVIKDMPSIIKLELVK